jgi:hypothetical protein
MLIATATVLHRVYTFDQTLAVTIWAGIVLTVALAAFSVYHCFTDSLLAHSALFGKPSPHTDKKSDSYRSHQIRHHDMRGRHSDTVNHQRQNLRSSRQEGCQETSYAGGSSFHLRIWDLEP